MITNDKHYYLTHGFPCINGFNARDGTTHECVKTISAWGNCVLNVLIYALQCKDMSGNVVIRILARKNQTACSNLNWSMLALLTNGISEIR